jgi:transposase
MKAYSQDLRKRIADAIGEGMAKREAARTYKIGLSTVKRLMHTFSETGSFDPKPIPGRPSLIKKDQEDDLRAQIKMYPDALLSEHCRMWKEKHGTAITVSAMSKILDRLNITRKKKRNKRASATKSKGQSFVNKLKN